MNGPCEDRRNREAWESLGSLLQRSSPALDPAALAHQVHRRISRRRRTRWRDGGLSAAAAMVFVAAASMVFLRPTPEPVAAVAADKTTPPLEAAPSPALAWDDDFDDQAAEWRQEATATAQLWRRRLTCFDYVSRDLDLLEGELSGSSL